VRVAAWVAYRGHCKCLFAATATPEELENWRSLFDEVRESAAAIPKVGLMKLRPLVPDEHRYAVAVREGSDLWLTLWVRCSPKPEFFVFMPRGDRGWDPHASYHRDGTLHQKSFDYKFGSQKRQCLTGAFRGTEHLGAYMGHGPKGVGAICDPTAFTRFFFPYREELVGVSIRTSMRYLAIEVCTKLISQTELAAGLLRGH
jgi:hypothetical protein